ncbi:SUMF1/EgtB/PvdO family nonheme iron enzyme [Micromonospora sp. DR5-3]|uniref:SUMF1/EgtB/PvdO family nonheme iron enzyme n=1 Tax=unclassified Micromonospora TaxID=2617518 RepID=UPI001CA30EA8|nr:MULTISPECIES: SUMF1/EgtB/PvdO family nonheme iron enzyme [unclassified Micromonospora]MCW3819041.1 SUMF1/EgtB/PvdO family nonheme iron enzyme [Micromonospora sp. DR5-3]
MAAAAATTLALTLLTATPAKADDYQLRVGAQQIAGPDRPADWPAWLAAMRQWRNDQRARIAYDDTNYTRPELEWAQHNPIQPQVMIEDRYLYDPKTRQYTVDRYLADVRQRYGGIDSVLIWPTYPNIGVDNRNTEDMFRAMPGGWAGVRQMVTDFHKAGVHVLFPIMVWDLGTRDPGAPWAEILPEMLADAGADGLNGDTMNAVTRDYFDNSVAAGRPLVLEPELGLSGGPGQEIMWNTQSWGYWDYRSHVPMVSINKWLEPRHTVHVNDRWSSSKIDMLQVAFFNGTGLESWENIWGIWNQMTDRDAEATRRVAAIERMLPDLLVSEGWEPHTPTVRSQDIFASKWPAPSGQTLWTIVNRGTADVSGDQIVVPHQPGQRYYDLWHGTELTPHVQGDQATLAFPIEGMGFGAVLASRPQDLPKHFTQFLTTMRHSAQRPLASFSTENTVLTQKMTSIAPTRHVAKAPAGMVYVPGANYQYGVRGTEIEGGNRAGVDVQYPWETEPGRYHARTIPVQPFYIDRTPITNAQFKRFLDTTGYRPRDAANFLKNWDWRDRRHPTYPKGWDDKPVTWVSIEDARAYTAWAGRRLPHSWEWQYAAQGLDGRNYPWGNVWDPGRVPETFSGRGEMRPPDGVNAHPDGASPFGALDMVGNVWQWTDEFTDEHTRAAILRGGSYYRALGSGWYFPSDQEAYRLDRHNKYLLMSPGRDRAATIGFRTVADAAGPDPGPVPASDGTVVDDATPGWRFSGWPQYGHVDAYNGGAHGGQGSSGQWAEYTFTGTGVDVYGWRGPNGGTIRVLVDGAPVGPPVSQHAPTDRYHQLLARQGGLADGPHTVRIEVDGATRSNQWTMVDYLRTYAANDRQPLAPPTMRTDQRLVPPGTTVTVTVAYRNTGGAPVSGVLSLSAPPLLRVTADPVHFTDLAPGREATAEVRVEVPAGAPGGSALLRAVASLSSGDRAEGWSTLAVLGAVDPVVARAGRANWVDLSWGSMDPEGGAVYEVYASTTRDFTPGPNTLVGTTGGTTFTHSGLDTEQTWYYRLRATDGSGQAGPYSRQVRATTGSTVIVEAESLVPLAEATAPYVIQTDCCGVTWSQGKQIWFQANAPGDRYTLTFSVPRAGRYDLTLAYTKAWDFGIHTQTLDGVPLGKAYDHAGEGVSIDRKDYGAVDLTAGAHRLTFTVTGKTDTSPRYGFGLDAIELTPLP